MSFDVLAVNYLEILVLGGQTIGFILWGLSFVTVALAIRFFLHIRRLNILPEPAKEEISELFSGKQYREAIDLTAEQGDFLSYLIHASLTEAPHGYPAMERAMEEAAEERTTKMLRSIEWLNLIGNIGPMLGLLGTVWGMIGAFFKIVEAGSPEPAKLAGDIGVALVTTLLGLAVSIPAISAYAILRNRIDALTSEAVMVSQELISTFRPVAKR
ncbi:MAG: MotA/TolQ/ExbB proton channel family protein [Planctomycetota bacterium]|nr:MAG: MotA/TolQ/ExbB proton channel family protein [Planctomycetota bacterium]